MAERHLTIGELAKRANVSTSLLRYYEKEKLLRPTSRSGSGYRLYAPDAEHTLRFIRSAQRLGFSLSDIKLILGADGAKGTSSELMGIAEHRFLDIERRATEMLVMRHELELFLDDLAAQLDRTAGKSAGQHYRTLLEQVCGHDSVHRTPSSLEKLVQRLGCSLASAEWEALFARLRGRHMHLWREDDGYSILFAGDDPEVGEALSRLAASEADCDAHVEPEVAAADGGWLFRARGPNAFLFAQLFLALEAAEA
jgi:DNA-binding transcriptional MerR regulator